MTVLNSNMGPISLGNMIGRGAEGSVYSIDGRTNIVAKIYHQPLSREKLRKLETMIRAPTPDLLAVTAWPQALLRDQSGCVGFLMPSTGEAQEAHILYGPKSRKQKFPDADFLFLVRVAKSIASAFATVHEQGFLVGDVNERVCMIDQEGTARLIDCDSFQVIVGDERYLCEVGVPIFTPPELQHELTFRGVVRTEQHDAFGLAVLLFHILFLGRHPYAGRYAGPAEMPIEQAIRENRFAYSADKSRTRMEKPPNTPLISYSGYGIASLFEQAFSPQAANGKSKRPTAAQWVEALQHLLENLTPCKDNAAHAYVPANGKCPWCEIELTSRVEVFNYVEPSGAALENIDVAAILQAISNLRQPTLSTPIDPRSLARTTHPSPDAQQVLRYRTQQERTRIAEARSKEGANTIRRMSERLLRIEQDAASAHVHVAAFDSDGRRLLHLQAKLARLERLTNYLQNAKDWLLWLGLPTSVGAISFAPDLGIGLVAGTTAAAWTYAALRAGSSNQRVLRHVTAEIHDLRVSVDLGLAYREHKAELADKDVAAAKEEMNQARRRHESAVEEERRARHAATESKMQERVAMETIISRYKSAKVDHDRILIDYQAVQARMSDAWKALLGRRDAAETVHADIDALERRRAAELQQTHNREREAQLDAYLDQFFIATETWPRIPKSILAALPSFGIETAADVEKKAVLSVPGFGEARTRILLEWRDRKARGFKFDPTLRGHSQRVNQMERRFSGELRSFQRNISKIKSQIDALYSQLTDQKSRIEQSQLLAARILGQALADGEALQVSWEHVLAQTSTAPRPTGPTRSPKNSTSSPRGNSWRRWRLWP